MAFKCHLNLFPVTQKMRNCNANGITNVTERWSRLMPLEVSYVTFLFNIFIIMVGKQKPITGNYDQEIRWQGFHFYFLEVESAVKLHILWSDTLFISKMKRDS